MALVYILTLRRTSLLPFAEKRNNKNRVSYHEKAQMFLRLYTPCRFPYRETTTAKTSVPACVEGQNECATHAIK